VFIQLLFREFVVICSFNAADRFEMSLTVEFYEIPVFTFPQVYAQVGEYNYGLVYVDECCFDFVPCLVEHFARNGQIPVKPGVPQSATLR